MQLNDHAIAKRLAIATSALLGTASLPAQADDGSWQVSSGLLLYSESDDRVQAIEPVLDIGRDFADESSVNVRLVYDALTGSSPNGAMAANVAQTFTSASAAARKENADEDELQKYADKGIYTIAPGDLPLDPSFEDNRTVLSLGWTHKLDTDNTLNLGGAYSSEGDFTSVSINAAQAREINNKNTTLSMGINFELDSIAPNGGVPLALSSYAERASQGSDESKYVVDVMAGVSQVINRRWLMQFNLGMSYSSGYQSDPYKLLTVANQGNLILDPYDDSSYLYLMESRPDKRLKTSLYWQNKVAIGKEDSMDVSYRYMMDDWGVNSHTLDLSYHWRASQHLYLQPHYRYYQQTAADFWVPFLDTDRDVKLDQSSVRALVDDASSDPRLAAFSAHTFGLKLGIPLREDEELTLVAEHYQQYDNNTVKSVLPGSNLDGQRQFAELSANWLQLGYTLRW